MIAYILTPAARAAFPDHARALDRLDADDRAFDDWSQDERAELRAYFARRRRQLGDESGREHAEVAA